MNYAKCPQCGIYLQKKKRKKIEEKRENLDMYKRTRRSTRNKIKIVYVKLRDLLNELEMKSERQN